MTATPQEIAAVLRREFIDKDAALRYAEKIAANQSPLAGDYQEAAYLLKNAFLLATNVPLPMEVGR